MMYPDENLDDWQKKTGLHVEVYSCPRCKKDFLTAIPFLTKDSFGLESPVHECGRGYTKVVMRPRSSTNKKEWDQIMENLAGLGTAITIMEF
jgi:hypothetical protein